MALQKCLLVFLTVCILRGNCYIRNTYLKRIRNGLSNGSVSSGACGTELYCLTDTLTKEEDIHLSMVIQCNCQSLGSDLYKKTRWKVIHGKEGSYSQVHQNTYTGRDAETDVFSYINSTRVNTVRGKLNNDSMVQTAKLPSVRRKSTVGDVMVSVRADTTTVGKTNLESSPQRDSPKEHATAATSSSNFIVPSVRRKSAVGDVMVSVRADTTTVGKTNLESSSERDSTSKHATTTAATSSSNFIVPSVRRKSTVGDVMVSVRADTTTVGKTNLESSPHRDSPKEHATAATNSSYFIVPSGRRKSTVGDIMVSVRADTTTVGKTNLESSPQRDSPKEHATAATNSSNFIVPSVHRQTTVGDIMVSVRADTTIVGKTNLESSFQRDSTSKHATATAATSSSKGRIFSTQMPKRQPGNGKTDVKNGPSLLVMAAENKAVYEFQLPKQSSAIQISFPKENKLWAVEFCPFYNSLKWVGKNSVFSSHLVVKAPRRFTEMFWSRGKLVTVKYDKETKLIFYVTTNGIHRMQWKSSAKPRIIANRIKPMHVELDEDERYVYWSEKEAGSVTFRRVDYGGSKEERIAVLKGKEVYRFSMFKRYIYYCGPTPQVMYRKKTIKVLDPKEKCVHVIRHRAVVYYLTHSSKVKVLNMKTNQRESWSLPQDITTGHLQFVGDDEKKAKSIQKERREPTTKGSRKTKPKSKPLHSSRKSKGSRTNRYDGSSRSTGSRPSSYDGSSRSRGSRPSSYDGSSRSRGSRPRSYDDSSRSRGSRPSSYDGSSRSRGSRPSSYDGSSRSRGSRPSSYDGSSRSRGSRPSSYDGSSSLRGSRPSSYDGSSRSRGSRPSSYDGSSRSRGSRPSNYDGSSRSRGSRPNSYDGSSKSRGPRPSSYDGSSRSRRSRPSNYDGSSRPRGSRPSSYDGYGRSTWSRHLLVMDAKNRLVWKINLSDFNLKYEIRLPGDDLIRDIDYSVSERKLLWIRSFQIIKTPLKTLRESDMSITSWAKSEMLLKVKTDNRRIFLITAKNIYKAHMPFNKKSHVYHVTRAHFPTDATLDPKKENVYWIELSRGLYSVNRVPYSGGDSVAVSHFDVLTGFTIGPGGIMYLCSPYSAKFVQKSYSKPQHLWGQNKCSDIASDGDKVYILQPPATIVVAGANGDNPTNRRRYVLDSNVDRGFLKIID